MPPLEFKKTDERLGIGCQGTVFVGYRVDTNEKVAIKTFYEDEEDKGNGDESIPFLVDREMNILRSLNHENVIGVYHVNREAEPYIVFELMDCDLAEFMETKAPLDLPTIKKFLSQIMSGLAYCHDEKCIHRDLKPKNILVKDFRIKISDFGLARGFGSPGTIYTSGIGTLPYLAPELLLGSESYSSPVDVWAAGCIFAEMVMAERGMVTTKHLFETESGEEEDQLKIIFSMIGIPTEESWQGVTALPKFPHDFKESQPTGLAQEVQRLQSDEPYGMDLLSKMLCLNPDKRITASQALTHEYFRTI